MRRTVILTTHDLDEVEALVESTIVLKDGRAVFHGEVQEMRRGGVYFVSECLEVVEAIRSALSVQNEVEMITRSF